MSGICKHPVQLWARGRGMLLKELAGKLGVSSTAIHYWRVGKNCPSPKVLLRIEEVTDGEVTGMQCVNYFMEKSDGK